MIPILLYHSVSDASPKQFGPYSVTLRQFTEHLDQLVAGDYTTLTVEQLIALLTAGATPPERTAVVTFDDGFRDFSTNAWPELKARQLNATLYVTTGTIGGTSGWLAPLGAGHLPMLSSRELVDLADDGCEMGAHSMSHPQLDCLSRSAAWGEIKESKTELEQTLGQQVNSFAYPHGYHDRAVKRMVVDAGYTSACAVRDALSHERDDVFALARVTVTSDFQAERIGRVLAGQGVPLARSRERLRTAGWRRVRRWQHRRNVERVSA